MKLLMIILSGGILVNNQTIDKTQFEAVTGTKVVEQGNVPIIVKKANSEAKKAQKKKKTVQNKKKTTKKSQKNVKKKSSRQKRTTKKVVNKRVRYNVGEIQSYAHQLVIEYGWSEKDYQDLVLLWYRESSWNPNARNKKSGACGIPQAKPCSKAVKNNPDYRSNWKTQVRWGLNYIKKRYGTPSEAWDHSQRTGWY